jgi:(S)-ureidoglycine aminohydrolase
LPYHIPTTFQRTQEENRLVRTRVRSRYALLPSEGYPTTNLPHWRGTEARILASPALGSQFVQYLLFVEPGGGTERQADGEVETFFFLLSGAATLTIDGNGHYLDEGGFALIPHTSAFELAATEQAVIISLRKRFEPAEGLIQPESIVGNESDVPANVWLGIEGARLQTLIPDDRPEYDMHMNIFTFEVGYSLPVVETHVMEHGLYFLQGKGLYYLEDEWMEVEAGDFIWMGPYVPQSFYATGREPSKYLYYKNVNRDVVL